jgi:hypothetical protein
VETRRDLGCPGLLSDVLPEDEEKKNEGLITEMGERIRGGLHVDREQGEAHAPEGALRLHSGHRR